MKARNPRWYESNLIARAGLVPDQWKIIGSNREYIRIWSKKSGAVKEIDVGGKMSRRTVRFDPSEGLARYMAGKNDPPAVAAVRESM